VEIPDKKKYLELHDLVISLMWHGPCGVLNKLKLHVHGGWRVSLSLSSIVLRGNTARK
jgi:fucose 4-O-acetylase-like acetyltransferase